MRNSTLALTLVALLAAAHPGHAGAPNKSGVGPGALSVPSGPGSIEGLGDSFEPQLNTGSATFGVGLQAPPGRAGLQPTVRLMYESGLGNGLAGLGWSCGFGMIRRQADKGFPAYSSADTFLLGGEELVPLSNAGQDWRCENEGGFQRIRQLPAQNAWEVTDRNGVRHIYGQYRGEAGRWSAVTHPGLGPGQGSDFDRTYAWHLDTTIDLHGNRIEYEYLPGTGLLYPWRVTYAHYLGNYHEVTFTYEDRPDIFDDYRPTFSMRTDRRLARVEMASFQGGTRQLVRAYDLEYSHRPEDGIPAVPLFDSGVSLLKRVVQTGRDGNRANYLPPLILTYTPFAMAGARARTLPNPPALNLAEVNGNVQLTDVDGDGLPDLFQTTEFDQRFMLNRGETGGAGTPLVFGPVVIRPRATDMLLGNPESTLADFNNDGLVDYGQLTTGLLGDRELRVFPNGSCLERWDAATPGFSQEAGVFGGAPAIVSFTNTVTRQMDVNFDKVVDFVTTDLGFIGEFRMAYRDSADQWQTLTTFYPNDMPGALTFDWNGREGDHAVYLADFNGDRLQDIVLVEKLGLELRVRYWPYCALGQFGEGRTVGTAAPDPLMMEAGDLRDVFVQDFTGDGLADLLMVDGSGAASRLVLRMNIWGGGWSAPLVIDDLPRYAPRDPGIPTTLRFADLNGNNSTDLIWVNPGLSPEWQWLDLMPGGKPNLLAQADNSLGHVTAITWGTSTEDMIRAREKGFPWRTKTPFPLPVIRRIRATCGFDLDGVPDGNRSATTDQYVSEFQYRDAYYDVLEREFRGFAFAQKVDYGDDFLLDTNLVVLGRSPGWDPGKTPTGQVSGPSLVARFRYYTGAPDGLDNDSETGGGIGYIDEITPRGGREEEVLKGMQILQEAVDPWVLHAGAVDADFDRVCFATAGATNAAGRDRITPDTYVYERIRQEWKVRRLYRSILPEAFVATVGGVPRDFVAPLNPPGRFSSAAQAVFALPESGRTVSYAFLGRKVVERIEANGLLGPALGHPARAPVQHLQRFEHDDYGNETRMEDWGIVGDASYDDERFVTSTYALGGEALDRWILGLPATIRTSDEAGRFARERRFHYDGADFAGLALGQVGSRGLLKRTSQLVTGDTAPPALEVASDLPGDPRRPAGTAIDNFRAAYDAWGNVTARLDPLAVPPGFATGHATLIEFDDVFHFYPVRERTVIGQGQADLVGTADFDYGFGFVIRSVDHNGNATTYRYDAFARLVAMVKPYDTPALPTAEYQYLPADPNRGRVYAYDSSGNLTFRNEVRPASRAVSRYRKNPGGADQVVSARYSDGTGRTLAEVVEGDRPGAWIASVAHSYNRREQVSATWLPHEINSGADDQLTPPFSTIWISTGRPSLAGADGVPVLKSDLRYDPTGRTLLRLVPAESFGAVANEAARTRSASQYLPNEVREFDGNDNDPVSRFAGTPAVTRFDGLGRMIEFQEMAKLDDAGRVIGSPQVWSTRYSYNLNNQLVQVRDSQQNVKWFRYDGLERKVFLNDLDRGPVRFTYDDADNLVEVVDAKGQRAVQTYDGANRILTEDYLDDASAEFSYRRSPDVRYHYDQPAGSIRLGDGTQATAQNVKGQLAWVEDATGEEHFSYDQRSRRSYTVKRVPDVGSGSNWMTAPLVSWRTAFSYDALDQPVKVVYPDNDEVQQVFNSRSQLIGVIGGPNGSIISNMVYRPSGQLSEVTCGNGVRTRYDYDPRQRTTELATQRPGGAELVHFAYSRDRVSNLDRIDDRRPVTVRPAGDTRRNSQSFAYDDLYRLTRVNYSYGAPGDTNRVDGQISYRYDRIGNLLEQTSDLVHVEDGRSLTDLGGLSYGGTAGRSGRSGRTTAEPGPHALTTITNGSRLLQYDANGNVVQADGLRYTWDFKDRLVRIESDQLTAEYRYDYAGRRVIKRVATKPGAATAGLPSSWNTIYVNALFEVRDDDQPVKYVMAGSSRIARITASLSDAPRLQRLRLLPGWNLVGLGVTATNLGTQIRSETGRDPAVLAWNPATGGYVRVASNDTVSAGSVLWIQSATQQVISVRGGYVAPVARTMPAGFAYVAVPGLAAWDVLAGVPTNTTRWFFRSAEQAWAAPLDPALASPVSQYLPPGGAFAVHSDFSYTVLPADPTLGIRYYHADHLGSVAAMSDGAGNLIQEAAYYPFGRARVEFQARDRKDPYAFTSKEDDRESRLNYFEARYLNSALGRFVSVDPMLAMDPAASLRQPQELNYYAYALNNPLKLIDPSGLDATPAESASRQSQMPPPPAVVYQSSPLMSMAPPPQASSDGPMSDPDHPTAPAAPRVITGMPISGRATISGSVEVAAGIWCGKPSAIAMGFEPVIFKGKIDNSGSYEVKYCAKANVYALSGRYQKDIVNYCRVLASSSDKAPASNNEFVFKDDASYGGVNSAKKSGHYLRGGGAASFNSRGGVDWNINVTRKFDIADSSWAKSGPLTLKAGGEASIKVQSKNGVIAGVVSGSVTGDAIVLVPIPQTGNACSWMVRAQGEGQFKVEFTRRADP